MGVDGSVEALANGRFMPTCLLPGCGWKPKHGSRTLAAARAYLSSHRSERHRGLTHADLADEDAKRRNAAPCTCPPWALARNGQGCHVPPCAKVDPCNRCLGFHPETPICPPTEALHLWNREQGTKAERRALAYEVLRIAEQALADPDGVTHQRLGEQVLEAVARAQGADA